jgi:hypothetical protein
LVTVRRAAERVRAHVLSTTKQTQHHCYRASRLLVDLLAEVAPRAGAEFVYGFWIDGKVPFPPHCWVVISDEIVDVTADQFGLLAEVRILSLGDDARYHEAERGDRGVQRWFTQVEWDATRRAQTNQDNARQNAVANLSAAMRAAGEAP